MKTQSFILPSYWACALLYGDESGLSELESRDLAAWLNSYPKLGLCVDCSETPEFRWSNDANNVGGDCLEFTFECLP